MKRGLICFLLCWCGILQAQKYTAKQYFEFGDYNRALKGYLLLLKGDKDNKDYIEKIGICYLNINGDRSQAIPYLERAFKMGGYTDELLLNLGKAYLFTNQLDKAQKFFNDYRQKTSSKNYDAADHLIENCDNARQFMKRPVNVAFENLGKNINSPAPDFFPFVTADEGTLYFTTSRAGIESSGGFFSDDIYYAKVKNGEWMKAKKLEGPVNTPVDEQCACISGDGKTMLVYIYDEVNEIAGDLFITSLKVKPVVPLGPKQKPPPDLKQFPKTDPLTGFVNTKYNEKEGWFSSAGDVLLISSDRPGGSGGYDIYEIKKLPNGDWGMPINLGPAVNTRYNERFPVYNEATHTLYFSSEGHTNMGGYDVFKCQLDLETQEAGQVVNLGYPVNTTSDDLQFAPSANGSSGYLSAYRKEGLGDLDIYRVTFKDQDYRMSVIKGFVIADSLRGDLNAKITLVNTKTNKEIDSRQVNPKTGKYLFAVEPGKYVLKVEGPGYPETKETVNVMDKTDYVFEIVKNIVLKK